MQCQSHPLWSIHWQKQDAHGQRRNEPCKVDVLHLASSQFYRTSLSSSMRRRYFGDLNRFTKHRGHTAFLYQGPDHVLGPKFVQIDKFHLNTLSSIQMIGRNFRRFSPTVFQAEVSQLHVVTPCWFHLHFSSVSTLHKDMHVEGHRRIF